MLGFGTLAEYPLSGEFADGSPTLERKDRVADTSTTTSTGTFTLLDTPPTGYRSFTSAHTDNRTVHYCITLTSGEWEAGSGVWRSAGNTLTRETVYASSNAGALVNFSAGTKIVACVHAVSDVPATPLPVANVMISRAAAASSTTAGWQKIPLELVQYDSAGIWSRPTQRATIQRSGFYWVAVQARFTTTLAAITAVAKNGAVAQYLGTEILAAQSVGGACLLYLAAGDYIEAYVYTTQIRAYDTTQNLSYFHITGPL